VVVGYQWGAKIMTPQNASALTEVGRVVGLLSRGQASGLPPMEKWFKEMGSIAGEIEDASARQDATALPSVHTKAGALRLVLHVLAELVKGKCLFAESVHEL